MTERSRRRQWIGLLLAAAGMAAATVVVPPLIAPRRAAPTPPSAPAASGAPFRSATVPAQFSALSVQAEDPANRLTGGASVVACATCRGGHRVRYLCPECALEVRFALPVAGTRKVTVWYEVDGPRSLKVSVNGAAARIWPVNGPDWSTPRSFDFTADLPAGQVSLRLYNDDSPAPDLDEIAIA
ncbi:hypothetical protein [Dactylosporangium sp. CA-139066]|uniref:hypothetical protein n=1 Tax=Dactylosporangium sp. CA-139066 TaxID=3239930 RepID=UPI003D93965C